MCEITIKYLLVLCFHSAFEIEALIAVSLFGGSTQPCCVPTLSYMYAWYSA